MDLHAVIRSSYVANPHCMALATASAKSILIRVLHGMLFYVSEC